MRIIKHITNAPKQELSILLDDGTSFLIEVHYMPLQQGWFIVRLEYKEFILRGLRICNSPNLLHQFKNILPFGLGCISSEKREPMLQFDFSEENSKLLVLTEEEVDQYQELLEGG